MKMPDDIYHLLLSHFQRNRYKWLLKTAQKIKFDYTIPLGIPKEKDVLQQPDYVHTWLETWKTQNSPGKLYWGKRQWKILGIQQFPEKLTLQGPEEIIDWIGQTSRWQKAVFYYQKFIAKFPLLIEPFSYYFDIFADYAEHDLECLLALLDWFNKNPYSNLYPRQLPIEAVDSKWLEKHKGMITQLVAVIQADFSPHLNFYQRCGLKSLPILIRMRILDPALRKFVSGLEDITAPIEQIAQLNLPASTVFIVENLQTGLAMHDLPGSVVFVRLGNYVDALGEISWINNIPSYYWGDIDTHGFFILHRARNYLPNLQSIMMNEETLLCHKSLWGSEGKQYSATELAQLTSLEHNLYSNLKQHYYGRNIRLEQERIAWEFAESRLKNIIHST